MRVITKLIHLKIIVGIIFGNVKIENRFEFISIRRKSLG